MLLKIKGMLFLQQASPEGRLLGDGVAVLRFTECLLDGLLAATHAPLACPIAAALGPLARPSRSPRPRNVLT